MMTNGSDYLDYLQKRSVVGLAYRRMWLYPRLSATLKGRVLDVGCGIGDMLRYRPGTTGADVNPEIVRFCRAQGLDVHQIIDGVLPFADGQFDTVLLDNVLEHVAEPAPLLRELRRVTAAGGRLVVGVPGARGYASDPDHKIFYDETSLVETVEAGGFRRRNLFEMPFRWPGLGQRLRIHVVYGVFDRA